MNSKITQFAPFVLAIVALAVVAVYLDFSDESSIGLVPTPTAEPTSLSLPTPTAQVAAGRATPLPRATPALPVTRLAVDVGFGHTATLLDDGRVLVAGGRRLGEYGSTDANAQTYDPALGVWRKASSMVQPRFVHTATLLEDGRVLVVGGRAPFLLRGAEVYNPSTNTWSSAGRLANARAYHAAVRIGDGLVMVIGGMSVSPEGEIPTATTEIYDAFTESWIPASDMATARAAPTMVAFPDGRVLVTGGIGPDGDVVASAEMYSPSTGLWEPVGAMAEPRAGHTATLLPEGRVLVAGGISDDSGIALATVELYDPVIGEWSQSGGMSEGRLRHTASLMLGGNVVVIGGALEGQPTTLEESGATLGSAEIYERSTGSWASVDDMNSQRSNHATVVLDSGLVMTMGGWIGGGRFMFSPAEILDPSTRAWSEPASLAARTGTAPPTPVPTPVPTATPRPAYGEMVTARNANHGVALLPDGKVLIAGGASSRLYSLADVNKVSIATAEIVDPTTGEWSSVDDMSTDRNGLTVTALDDGRALVAGGIGLKTIHGTAELLDPSSGTWSETGNMAVSRVWHRATKLRDGRVLVTGGFDAGFAVLASTEIYDPATGEWSPAADLIDSRAAHQAILLPDGRVLVLGGSKRPPGFIAVTTAEVYDPLIDQWSLLESYSRANDRPGIVPLSDGTVLVTRGWSDGQRSRAADILDPAADTWTPVALMGTPRTAHIVVQLDDGRVLVAGGTRAGPYPLSSAEVFDPRTGDWSLAGDMNVPRTTAKAVLLPDGGVMVIGGSGIDGLALASAEIFDPETESWTLLSDLRQ